MDFVGSLAERYAEQFNVDVAFFSSKGLSEDGIISDTDVERCMIRKIVMAHSKKNIFLFEPSKLNKKYFYRFGQQIISINMIGTDFQYRNNGSDQDSDEVLF